MEENPNKDKQKSGLSLVVTTVVFLFIFSVACWVARLLVAVRYGPAHVPLFVSLYVIPFLISFVITAITYFFQATKYLSGQGSNSKNGSHLPSRTFVVTVIGILLFFSFPLFLWIFVMSGGKF